MGASPRAFSYPLRLLFSAPGTGRADPRKGDVRLSDRNAGGSNGPEKKGKKSAPGAAPRKKPARGSDIGRALRSVYDETLREDVPDDFQSLLSKLD